MRKFTGAVFLSLDGVMQAPGGPEEDPTSDFRFPDGEVGRRVRFLDRFFDLHVMSNMQVPVFNGCWLIQ